MAESRRGSGSFYSPVNTEENDGRNSFELQSVSPTQNGDEVEAAVVVRNADLWYKAKSPVLSGLNMTVPDGSMSSKLNHGSVFLFGEKPGTKGIGIPGRNIGYMPQEVSLYEEFTVMEMLYYFGAFSGMSEEQVGTEVKFLVNLLDLPSLIRRIGTLSGGEKRRVSFAAALIPNPQLLILDEPTVGVDAILRQQIWNYLSKLVTRRGTTVIITSHYIDEARQANMIGVIRNGKIIVEKPPQQLIEAFCSQGNSSLENAVLNLCKEDSMIEIPVQTEDVKMAEVENECDEAGLGRSVTKIKAMTKKNILVLKRNLLLLLFVIWIPAFEMIFVGIAFGYEPQGLKIGVVNHEVSNSICAKHVPKLGKCEWTHLSCVYLSHIPTVNVKVVPFDSEEDAESAVGAGEIWGYLRFPQNFSERMYERTVLGAKVDEFVITSSDIIGKFDETNKHITTTIKSELYTAFSNFLLDFLSSCGLDPRQKQSALRYRTPIFGKDDTDLREYASPSMSLAAMFFFPIISIGIRLIDERKCGMMERSLVAGVKTWEVIVAYLISESCILVAQSVLVLAVVTLITDIKILGSWILVLALFASIGYAGVSLGFLFGSLCREKIDVAILAMACFMPNVILCGVFWPVEGMPEFVQKLVLILPCTLPAESVRSVISRGWGISHYNVWIGFVSIAGQLIFNLMLTIFLHKL
ncbi:ABC transporter G family member 23 [Orchesella cincta]|uniref:ABC transporter G family member 23 n=1 Tax=Orchesella cincta TaxID=48709 RepID=A0A1D2MI67_ORCCI|nr:ABC transporter G family member 23 [Orchesella cincta]